MAITRLACRASSLVEAAVAGADLDDQLVRSDVEPADDVLGVTPTAEEVLREPATRATRLTRAA
jgi:hypothetical protein